MSGTLEKSRSIPAEISTAVIGGSQAGLSVSNLLKRAQHDHVVLEADRIGTSWRNKRWDSFCLVTPNWMNRLPGFAYGGDNPDGFLQREEIIDYLRAYSASFEPPLYEGVSATRLAKTPKGFEVSTTAGILLARNVVVCVGYFHDGKLPKGAAKLDSYIFQVHSRDYKNP